MKTYKEVKDEKKILVWRTHLLNKYESLPILN